VTATQKDVVIKLVRVVTRHTTPTRAGATLTAAGSDISQVSVVTRITKSANGSATQRNAKLAATRNRLRE